MIKELRIDDRLIHGQVALTWPKTLCINHIIVANDNACVDKAQQVTLKMAAQGGDTKVLIRSVSETINFFENQRARVVPIMIIVNSVSDAYEIYKNLGKQFIERINIANVGRFDEIPTDQKKKIASSVYITQKAIDQLLEIVDDGEKVVNQVVPEKKADPFINLVKR